MPYKYKEKSDAFDLRDEKEHSNKKMLTFVRFNELNYDGSIYPELC